MTDKENKYQKLRFRLMKMVADLHDFRKAFEVQQRIDQFQYMQMEQELKFLCEQMIDTELRLKAFKESLDLKYLEAYYKWSSDVRWLSRYADTHRVGDGSESIPCPGP